MNGLAAEIHIRPMAASDLDRVIEIASSLPAAPHWPRSAYKTALDAASTPRRVALVAASASNKLAGFAVSSLVPPAAELESIAVAAESQRQGVGRRLFHALAEELRRQGTEILALEVRASSSTVFAFYCSIGFVQTGLRPRYYVDPVEDAVLMEYRLR